MSIIDTRISDNWYTSVIGTLRYHQRIVLKLKIFHDNPPFNNIIMMSCFFLPFCMYNIYAMSGPSLLIESTDYDTCAYLIHTLFLDSSGLPHSTLHIWRAIYKLI